jgi:hypothetical protein
MDLLVTDGIFGEVRKHIKVVQFKAGGAWEIFVDNYREGSIIFYGTKPMARMHERSLLTGDDLMILLDMLQGLA